jgi:DNA-directed RNA polymerase specialized sigma24 family protein
MIAGVRRGDLQVAFPALCEGYWDPLFTFICAIGCHPEEARDVTQGMFESMLTPGFFNKFDPSLGKFRNWLRTAARHFYFNSKRGRRPELAGVDVGYAEEHLRLASNDTSEPDRAFDRALTKVVVERALERLRRRYEEGGQLEQFSRLQLTVVGERLRTFDAEVAKDSGTSVPKLKKDRFDDKCEWKMGYRGCLREELAALGVKRSNIDRVVAELIDVLR